MAQGDLIAVEGWAWQANKRGIRKVTNVRETLNRYWHSCDEVKGGVRAEELFKSEGGARQALHDHLVKRKLVLVKQLETIDKAIDRLWKE